MYLAHYHLDKEPFNVGPDPAFIWLGEKNRHVLDTLGRGVLEPKGCVVLCGDVGTGKTTLVNYLAAQEGMSAIHVALHEPDLTALDFCNLLALELRMERSYEDRQQFHAALPSFLMRHYGALRRLLVVVEEAERVNREVLAELEALSRRPVLGRSLLKVVMVGGPQLEALLEPGGGSLGRMPVAAFCRLEPFSPEDTQRYIEHRLRLAGAKQPLFSPGAVKSVFTLSKGYPRLINMVCDHALLCGYGAHLEVIGEQIIQECSRDLAVALDLDEAPKLEYTVDMIARDGGARPEPPREPSPRHLRGMLMLAVAIGLVGAALYFFLR